MMEQLGRAEDEMLEKEHELAQVKEDRDKHFRVILQQQERLAREILLVSQPHLLSFHVFHSNRSSPDV
jgi:hypothetical protein